MSVRNDLLPNIPPRNKCMFDNMPRDILLNIFSFLTVEERKKCFTTCKDWKVSIECLNFHSRDYHAESYQTCEFLLSQLCKARSEQRKMKIKNVAAKGALISAIALPMVFLFKKAVSSYFSINERIQELPNIPEEQHEQVYRDMYKSVFGTDEDGSIVENLDYSKNIYYRNMDDVVRSLEEEKKVIAGGSGVLGLMLGAIGGVFLNEEVTRINQQYQQTKWTELAAKVAYPEALSQNESLSRYVCTISGRVALVPVKDSCGHFFDYLFIKARIIQNGTCPVSGQQITIQDLKFQNRTFYHIQTTIGQLNLDASIYCYDFNGTRQQRLLEQRR
jgi:hypothetical protein